jgi:DNA polymerase-3 subunit alpha
MPAVALTDRNNLFGLVKFYEACIAQGVKPIVGAELKVVDHTIEKSPAERVIALAMNATGYGNLIRLVSQSFTECDRRGVLREADVFSASDGLIVLSGGIGGHLWSFLAGGDLGAAQARARRWRDHLGDRYYIEVTRTGRAGEEAVLRDALTLAAQLELGAVATNDVCFATADDFEAHETRVCIHEGRTLDDPRRERRYSEEQYLKTADEMVELFADLPELCANSVEIAKRCNVQIQLGTYFLPDYPIPDGQTLEGFLEETAHSGLRRRLDAQGMKGEATEQDYRDRLDFELDVINQMGFAGYFLIVMEFIAWARDNVIPVGPGRGSGAGSLVAYSLGITNLDPLEYDLLFERFLNPERVSMPDFDVDFCMEGRDRVIQHVSELYGVDAVSQIITFGTMAAKAVVRDVARVQGKPYGLADKLSKLIPFEVGMTLAKAMDESAELNEFVDGSEEVGEIMDMAYKLEGIVRNVGKHAGGVVIAPSTLTDFVPLYTEDAGGSLVSQYDKDDVERAGLVKFDFLGLKTLTIIDWAVRAINDSLPPDAEPVDIERIDLEDRAAFDLLRAADTTGIFQLESRGMKDLIIRLQPDGINDVIALVALFRPGPLQSGAVDDYINRKHNREPVAYPHPSLEPVLDGTYGVVLYQEQVMQIAQELAGFSLGQADLLRRAMGKKKPEEMARVREQFLAGTDERDVDHKLANDIFDLMEKFAGYAFNKSHSATYAVVSVQTAWLKAHHPAHFMAANLSADMQNIDRVVVLIDEVRRMGVPLLPPSVNLSAFKFSVQNDSIVYGLGAVRGVGEGPVEAIVTARRDGSFKDLTDFCRRVDGKRVNKRVMEALIASGAMDEFAQPGEDTNHTRARLAHELPKALHGAEQVARNHEVGIADMFGGADEVLATVPDAKAIVPLVTRERLQGEKETLGLYLTGHPIEEYQRELRNFCPQRIVDLRAQRGTQSVSGMVVSSRIMKSRRGAPMCFLVLDDRSARLEVSLFPETYEKYGRKVTKDELLVIEGEVQADEFTGGLNLRAEKVYDIGEARQRFSGGVMLDFSTQVLPNDFNHRLKSLLEPYLATDTGCPVAIRYVAPTAQAEISLGREWQVAASDDLLRSLKQEFGQECVQLRYA